MSHPSLIRAGLKRAKDRGVKFGRPATLPKRLPEILPLVAAGKTVAEISRLLGMPYSSTHKCVQITKSEAA